MHEADAGTRAETRTPNARQRVLRPLPGPPRRVGDGIAESTGLARQACAGPTEQGGIEASSLMEEVVSRENLLLAYRRVKRNQGAPGVFCKSTSFRGRPLQRLPWTASQAASFPRRLATPQLLFR